jgi:hypothetical protein
MVLAFSVLVFFWDLCDTGDSELIYMSPVSPMSYEAIKLLTACKKQKLHVFALWRNYLC